MTVTASDLRQRVHEQMAQVRRIDVETIDQISLVLKGRRTVVWGSGEESDLKADVLAALVEAQDARTYDVSVPGSPVTAG